MECERAEAAALHADDIASWQRCLEGLFIAFEAADAAQVDARDVLDVRQVLRQRELAAVVQLDAILAMLRANVADQANDCAGEDAFDVGAPEDQLLDLRGPRHGRQHLEGVLAVNLLAAADVELQQSPKHLEVLELASDLAVEEVHARQLRALLERLDVAFDT